MSQRIMFSGFGIEIALKLIDCDVFILLLWNKDGLTWFDSLRRQNGKYQGAFPFPPASHL